MLQAKAIIKPLMGLTIAATLLTIGVIITMVKGGYIGNGSNGSTLLCNYYLILKYNYSTNQIYLTTFLMTILSLVSSIMQCAFLICFLTKCRQIEQNNSSQPFDLSPLQINRHYIFCSISILGLIATAGSYCGMFFQIGNCLNLYYLMIMAITFLSFVALVLLLIGLIIVIRYAVQRTSVQGENVENNNKKMNANQLGGRQQQRSNVFQMEGGSEMYRTIKRQNQQNLQSSDKNQPLLYQNSPIPIHNGDTTQYKAQMAEQVPTQYNDSITSYRKRSTSPERLQSQFKKSKTHEMIQKKKKKFREINPFKKQLNPNDKNQDEDDLLDEKPKINGIQKTNKQLLRESKRPLRKAPHISSLYAAMEEAKRKAQDQQLGDVERRNKLNKIKKQRQQQLVLQEQQQPEGQEQPNQNRVRNASIEQSKQNMNSNDKEEMFFHRPKIDGVIDRSRKKKQLFEEEVEEPNPILFLDQEKNQDDIIVVVNKLHQNKILRKSQMNKAPIVANKQNAKLAKAVKPKSKQQLQLQFLKSKYQQPEDQPEQVLWNIAVQQIQGDPNF